MQKIKSVEITCEACKTVFLVTTSEARRTGKRKHRFCSRRCSKLGSINPMWKGENASVIAGRTRAQHMYPDIGPCEKCGSINSERHHKDENTHNNDRSNIEILCRRCHMSGDGRLEAFRILAREVSSHRGRAVRNRNKKARTHCLHGHEFTESNTKRNELGHRSCRQCLKASAYRYWLRNQDKVRAAQKERRSRKEMNS